jgi:glycosyltransferase involved in cell wall biosynthesis
MITSNFRISIIVPFYNVELYFRDFLESLLPLENNCEILLIDDGSKDSSALIAVEFEKRFNNVSLYRKENGGLSSARNFGMEFAKGDFICFFDSDDYIEDKNVIYSMFEAANNNDADIIVAPYYEFFKLDEKKYRFDKVNFNSSLISLDDKLDKLFKNDISFAVWNKMYKKSFLDDNNINFKEGVWFEDLDFIFRSFFYANKIVKIDTVLLGYRQRQGSIMRSISTKMLDKIYVLDGLYIFLEENRKLGLYYEKFKVLYLRMVFSVLYSAVLNRTEKEVKDEIVKEVFKFSLFNKILNEPLVAIGYMSFREKVFYYLLRYKICNESNLLLINSLISKKKV